jgi:hypothetical protein
MKKKLSLIGLILVLALSSVFVMAVPASAAVTTVTTQFPTATNIAYTLNGGSVQVVADVTTDSAGYYALSVYADDGAGPPPAVIVNYSEIVYLLEGTTTISRTVGVLPAGITPDPLTTYDLTVTVGGISDTVALADNIAIVAVPGATITTTLAGKGVVIVEAILDQFVEPSDINAVVIQTGDCVDALTPNGLAMVQDVGNLVPPIMGVASDGVDIAAGVVSGIKGAAITNVPPIVNGVLKVASEIVGLFSTATPLSP